MKNKFKNLSLALAALCCISMTLSAQSAKLLTPKDSVFMFVQDGQKILMHPVKKGQTLYSIGKFYSISNEELMAFNPWYKDDNTIASKDQVMVPVPNKAIHRRVKSDKLKNYAPLYYVVQKGDNLFQISKRYFDMSVEEVKKRNKLKSETLELGQYLHVGWVPVSGIPKEWRSTASTTTPKGGAAAAAPIKAEVPMTTHKAMWVKDKKTVTGNFCLTNLAAKGTVVVITCPETKKSIEATVVGKLNIVQNKSVKLVLSETAAQSLGLTEQIRAVQVVPKK